MSSLGGRETRASFTTFCHISQFGDMGYRAMPRMIAMSTPCLWSPSSVVLKAGSAGISPATFLRYLDSGKIRVFGRYEWLQDRRWRESQGWAGSAWDEHIDGTIRNICDEDTGKPLTEQRVVIAPQEAGWEWAASYLEANPQEITRWQQLLRNEHKRRALPRGTREAALRDSTDPFKSAQRILRDAYNHGQAIAFSGADTAFLLQRTHRDFLRILAQAPASPGLPLRRAAEISARAQPEVLKLAMADLASQMLQILAELDVHARKRGRQDSLDQFVSGAGRDELMQWMSRIFLLLKEGDARRVNDLLLMQLQEELGQGRFEGFIRQLATRPREAIVGLASLVSAVIGLLPAPGSAVALSGVGLAMYPVGKGLARQMGWASADFSGPQWPFLYTYGKRSKRGQEIDLRFVLEHLEQEREFR